MEGNGPILGTSKMAGVIVGGSHPPSVDVTCCEIMGIDPEKIKYLQLVRQTDLPYARAIQQIGETIRTVRANFSLLPQFQHLRLNA